MKRKKLLPADIEQIEKLVPYRLKQEDIDKLRVTIAGFEFILLGGTLICPTCGQPQEVRAQASLDGEIYFFLAFRCTDYPQSQGALPAPATPAPDNTQQG